MTGVEPAQNDVAAWNWVPGPLLEALCWTEPLKCLALAGSGGRDGCVGVSESWKACPEEMRSRCSVLTPLVFFQIRGGKVSDLRDEGSFRIFCEWNSELDGAQLLCGGKSRCLGN